MNNSSDAEDTMLITASTMNEMTNTNMKPMILSAEFFVLLLRVLEPRTLWYDFMTTRTSNVPYTAKITAVNRLTIEIPREPAFAAVVNKSEYGSAAANVMVVVRNARPMNIDATVNTMFKIRIFRYLFAC